MSTKVAATSLMLLVVCMLFVTMATGSKSRATIIKNQKKRNLHLKTGNDKHSKQQLLQLQKVLRNAMPASRRKHNRASTTSTANFSSVVNELSNNSTKRWLESSYARGYHDSHPVAVGGLDYSTTSIYEDKGRQNYFTGGGVGGTGDQDLYGSDMEAYLKPGIGDYPSDMDGANDDATLKLLGFAGAGTAAAAARNRQAQPQKAKETPSALPSTSLDSSSLLFDDTAMFTGGGSDSSSSISDAKNSNKEASLSSSSTTLVSDAINQDEVSPAKVIDNALANIENEASQLIKESRGDGNGGTSHQGSDKDASLASGSGAGGDVGELGEEHQTASSVAEKVTATNKDTEGPIAKGETRDGSSNAVGSAIDANKELKEATQNSPEDGSTTASLADSNKDINGSGSGDTANHYEGTQDLIKKLDGTKADHRLKPLIRAKHEKGTRRQGEIWDGLNGERGEDADSAVNNHLISNKLLSSIKQVLAGADEDEEQGRLRETEALNKLEAAVGTSLQDRKHEDHQDSADHLKGEGHSYYTKASSGGEDHSSSMINEEADDRANQQDTPPIVGSNKSQKGFSNKAGSGGDGNSSSSSKDGKEAMVDGHKGKQKLSKGKLEKSSKHLKQEDMKKKMNKNNKDATKMEMSKMENGDEDNASNNVKVYQSPLDVGAESSSVGEEESNVDGADGGKGDLLEDSLMKMDKRKLVHLLAKFMRDRKKSQGKQEAKDGSEKNTQTPLAPNLQAGGGSGGQMPMSIHPLLLSATSSAALHSKEGKDEESQKVENSVDHKLDESSQQQQQFVNMHDLPMTTKEQPKADQLDHGKDENTNFNKNVDSDDVVAASSSGKNKDGSALADHTTKTTHNKLIKDPYDDIGSKDPADGDKAEQNNRHAVAGLVKEVKKESGIEEKEDNEESKTTQEDKVAKEVSATEHSNKNDDKSIKISKEQDVSDSIDKTKKPGDDDDEQQQKMASAHDKNYDQLKSEQEKERKFNKDGSATVEDAAESSAAMISVLKNQNNEKQHHDSKEESKQTDISSSLVDKILEKEKAYTGKLTSDLHQQLSSSSNEDEEKSGKDNDKTEGDDSKTEDREVDKESDEKTSEALLEGNVAKEAANSKGDGDDDDDDDNIKKLIHHIKEKLAAKKSKKHSATATNSKNKDVYAEIGTPGKRDTSSKYVSKSPNSKHRRHMF